jgi:hypothetical protein
MQGQRVGCFISVGTMAKTVNHDTVCGRLLAGSMTLQPSHCLFLFIYYLVSDFLLFLR